jgi:hypothetical protein
MARTTKPSPHDEPADSQAKCFVYEGTPDIPVGMTIAEWRRARATEQQANNANWIMRCLRRRSERP